MRIDRLDLRLCRLPLVSFFETSFGRSLRSHVPARPRSKATGHEGWGEAVAEANPYYSSETTETAWHIITEFLAPRVLGRDVRASARGVRRAAPIRGHNMAKAAVEMAAWDLYARIEQPAARRGARRHARAHRVGRLDRHPGLARSARRRRSARELAAGYQRIKIKIKPGWDIAAVERVRARFGDIPLMVDANAAYTLDDAGHLARARPVRADDDRAAARLRRCDRSRGAAAAIADADLPGRVDPHGAHRPRRDCRRRLPHHQHQAGPRRRPSRVDPRCTISAPSTAFRSGTAACSKPASAARTTSTSRACRTSRCRATSPPASATTRPI